MHASYIFVISVLVFLVFNVVENLVHYNIGVNTANEKNFKLYPPTKRDLFLILIVMLIFGLLQGFFTILIDFMVEKKRAPTHYRGKRL